MVVLRRILYYTSGLTSLPGIVVMVDVVYGCVATYPSSN